MDDAVNISEIIDALRIIRNECSKHSNCSDCAFYSNDRCNIKYTDPEFWELESTYIWRAFK